jgi:hypothetical protein
VFASRARPAVDAQSGFAVPSPPAQRGRRARWKDGRLLVGVLLVAGSALAGAKVLSTADNTTPIWVAKRVITAGTKLTSEDLVSARVRFSSGDAARTYISTDAALDGRFAVRQIGAGEFVPRDAVASEHVASRIEVPLSVGAGRLPADIAVGNRVDVWVVPRSTGQALLPAHRLWQGVQILQLDTARSVVGTSVRRQVLVAVSSDQAGILPNALAQLGAGEPVLVRRGG